MAADERVTPQILWCPLANRIFEDLPLAGERRVGAYHNGNVEIAEQQHDARCVGISAGINLLLDLWSSVFARQQKATEFVPFLLQLLFRPLLFVSGTVSIRADDEDLHILH